MHKSVIRNVSAYLTNLLYAVPDVPSQFALHDASNGNFTVPERTSSLARERFQSPHLLPGIACLPNSRHCDQLQSPAPLIHLSRRAHQQLYCIVFKRGLKTFLFRIAYIEQQSICVLTSVLYASISSLFYTRLIDMVMRRRSISDYLWAAHKINCYNCNLP